MIDGDLLQSAAEFLQAGGDEETKGRYRSALTLYFKAIAVACDIALYRKIKKIPGNHAERFKLLDQHFPALYVLVDRIFTYYTDTYSKPVTAERCAVVRDTLHEIIKLAGIDKEIKGKTPQA
jgi:hypothetical protein